MSTTMADSNNVLAAWLFQGSVIADAHKNHQFDIGDWLVDGEEKFGRKAYREALQIFQGYSKPTLQDYATVARRVPGLVRTKGLDFVHHKLVARFFPNHEYQKELLNAAVSSGWSKETFRAFINKKHPVGNPRSLAERFGAPPFSVLDTKQGYWLKRNQAWTALGICGEEGRGSEHQAVYSGLSLVSCTDISVFNPALTETVYQWFAPVGGGHILDPFAGGSTRGVIAAKLGHKYTGIELRSEQVEENRKQAERIGVAPTWICGDSAELSSYVTDQEFDLIFTSPPYFDLERYTAANKQDGSGCKTYVEFMSWYENIFRQAVARLKQDRFLVVQVGEIRDEKGFYRNFVGDTVSCFLRLGLRYYNEMILATPIGSCPLRGGNRFTFYRKVHKVHQNILVFWKGDDAKRIPNALGILGAAESEPVEEAA